MSEVRAVDVSFYQGQIDWPVVKNSGIDIAIIKMGGGDAGLYADSKATANYYGAKNAGVSIGGYWFAGGGDAVNEADCFISYMSPMEENDVFCLDWEIPHNDPVNWCSSFLTRVHDRTGVWPLLYINLATLNAYDWSPVLKNCGLWLAAWNDDPEALLTDHTYVMHQYSSNGSVPGIAGRVDLDMWFGTIEQFKAYGYKIPGSIPDPVPGPTPEPTPVPPPPEPTPSPEPPETPPETPPIVLPPPNPPSPRPNFQNSLLAILASIVAAIVALIALIRS